MLVTELIPKRMELSVVRSMDNMAKSVCFSLEQKVIISKKKKSHSLMQHGINNILQRKKLALVSRISQPETDLLPCIDIQPKEIPFGWVKFA